MDDQVPDFSLDEARALLAAVRDLAPGALGLPLSRADAATLLSAGIEIKSLEDGLVDFPATVEGVPAYWCWRVGEPDIEWWHPRESGFAGRRHV